MTGHGITKLEREKPFRRLTQKFTEKVTKPRVGGWNEKAQELSEFAPISAPQPRTTGTFQGIPLDARGREFDCS